MASFLYLVHDLADATVHKRVSMLKSGGADVIIAGFYRSDLPPETISDCPVIDLGKTYNADFKQRIVSVIKVIFGIRKHKDVFQNADVIVARNLEMLAIAVRGRHISQNQRPLIYESLDIHRLLLRKDFIGNALRKFEGWLASKASRLWTSSPAFISGYFEPLSRVKLPITLLENKVFNADNSIDTSSSSSPPYEPWIIGWFGAIRCRKSLNILADFVRQRNDVRVVIRGRPSYDQFDDFDLTISESDGIEFLGSYKNPDDLASIYGAVHFTWAIDMFEEGLNSSWLLPNRLYEGGLFSCVPIAHRHVYTGEYLDKMNLGVLLETVSVDNLNTFFDTLSVQSYKDLKKRSQAIAQNQWLCSIEECEALVKEAMS